MACNDCPELNPNPNEGCLQPINSSCVTYDGNDVDCADIASGQTISQVIETLANNDCELQEQLDDLEDDLQELSGVVLTIEDKIQELSGNQYEFSCEQLSECELNSLGNVDTNPVSGDSIIFNGEKWINYTPEQLEPYQFTCQELSGCSLDSLGNVIETSSTSGDILIRNSTTWVNQSFASLYSASNGLTKTLNNIKLGGTLIENTTIDSASYDFTFNNVGKLGIFSGSAIFAPKTYFQSAHNVSNPTNTLGCQTNILETNATLSSYSLTNGKTFINSLFSNNFTLGSSITIQDGSHVSNTFNYQSFNATGSTRNLTIDQSSGLRVLGNQKVATILSFSDYLTTINHYANLEIINAVLNVSNINTFTNFYQLLIRKAYGTGALLATSSNLVNTYGIYQEGTADKNVFYGEIEYHGALTNASDLRSKNKGEAFTKGLDIINQINPVNFTKKEGFGATDVNHVGIIAQELEQILPEAIKIGKCQDIEDFRFYDQSVLLYTLLNAVKELSQKVNQLENGTN